MKKFESHERLTINPTIEVHGKGGMIPVRDPFEYEIFLSFWDDAGAEAFLYWWNEEGKEAFGVWGQNKLDEET